MKLSQTIWYQLHIAKNVLSHYEILHIGTDILDTDKIKLLDT